MAQGSSRIFDDLGRLMNDAASVADGVRREAETAFRGQMERIVNDLDLVRREDFDALRDLVSIQSEEIETLKREIATLKGEEAAPEPGASSGSAGPKKGDATPDSAS